MAETLRDLVVSLTLDSDNFSRNLRSIDQQIKEAQSVFKLAAAGVEKFDKSIAGAQAKAELLRSSLDMQKNAVTQWQRALASAQQRLKNNQLSQQKLTEGIEDGRKELAKHTEQLDLAKEAYETLRDVLGENNEQTQDAKKTLEYHTRAVEDDNKAIDKMQTKLVSVKKATLNSVDAISKAQTGLNNAEAAIKDTSEQLRIMESRWTQTGIAMTAFGTTMTAAGKKLTTAGRTMNRYVTTPILALGTAAIKASVDYESAFAGVMKTVDETDQGYKQLSDGIKEMSTRLAMSASDIAAVVEVAGQLGISGVDNLLTFTETMIKLGISTDMASTDAASSLARFMNIMGTQTADIDRIGAAITALGNNYATTESEITQMAMRIAAAGNQIGLSEAQVLGLAAALSSVGLESEAGGTAISRALMKMEAAAASGGQSLKDFAYVAQMTEEEFAAIWSTNPIDAFMAFIDGLAQIDENGESTILTLDELGFNQIRLRDTLLRATNANELFASTQTMAAEAYAENTALTVEANRRLETTESTMTNLANKAVNLAMRFGDDLAPEMEDLIGWADGLLDKFEEMDEGERKQILNIAKFAATAGPAVLILGKMTNAVGSITTGMGNLFKLIGKAGVGVKANPWVLAFTGIAAAVGWLSNTVDDSFADVDEAWDGIQEKINSTMDGVIAAQITGEFDYTGAEEALATMNSDLTAQAQSVYSNIADALTDGEADTGEVVSGLTTGLESMFDDAEEGLAALGTDGESYAAALTELEAQTSAWIAAMAGQSTETVLAHLDELYAIQAEVEAITAQIDAANGAEGNAAYRITRAGGTLDEQTVGQAANWVLADYLAQTAAIEEARRARLEALDAAVLAGYMTPEERLMNEELINQRFDQMLEAEEEVARQRGGELFTGLWSAMDKVDPASAAQVQRLAQLTAAEQFLMPFFEALEGEFEDEASRNQAEVALVNALNQVLADVYGEEAQFDTEVLDDTALTGAGLLDRIRQDLETETRASADNPLLPYVTQLLDTDFGSMLGLSADNYMDVFSAAMGDVGQGGVDGLSNSLTDGSGQVEEASGEMAQAAIGGAMATLEERSPSRKFYDIGANAIQGMINGMAGKEAAMLNKIRAMMGRAVKIAKETLDIHSPSGVFRDEVGAMMMQGMGEGVTQEMARQADIIRNAAQYMTQTARGAANTYNRNDNRQNVRNDNSVTLTGNTFYVRSEQDIHALAVEIATLTKANQYGRGMKA